MQILSQIWMYLLLLFVLTFLFGLIPVIRNWHQTRLQNFVSFSAGVLVVTAFVHILPEVFMHSRSNLSAYGVFAGFLFMFLLEEFVMIDASAEKDCSYHTLGISAFIGIGLHSFFDGVALGSSSLSPALFFPVFIAILIHKLPSAFALSSLLKSANWKKQKITLALLGFSLIIPVAVVVSILFLTSINRTIMQFCFAFAMGSFVYIATSDFLPQVHREQKNRVTNLIAFILGIVGALLLTFFHGHSHH